MFFGLFFGFLATASADTELYDNLMYKAKALLENEQCRDAEKVTKKLTKEFPTDHDAYTLVFWRWNINSKQKAKEQADLTLYQTSLKQPISLNPERGTPQ